MKRNGTIDYLKAFAIILVVFYHGLFSAGLSWSSYVLSCITIILRNVHVPLFILISGFLCHPQSVIQFYKKKITRILIPFIFMSILKLIFNIFITNEFAHGTGIGFQLYNAFICGGLYWYCYCLLIMFLLAPFFWNSVTVKWILLAAAVIANTVITAAGIELTNVLQINTFVYYLPLFIAGMLIKDLELPEKIRNSKHKAISIFAAIAAFLALGYVRLVLLIDCVYLIDILLGISVMYLLYILAETINSRISDGLKANSMISRILTIIGGFSLQVMLLDSIYRVILFKIAGFNLGQNIITVFLITGIVVTLSCVTCHLAKKLPVVKHLLGLG